MLFILWYCLLGSFCIHLTVIYAVMQSCVCPLCRLIRPLFSFTWLCVLLFGARRGLSSFLHASIVFSLSVAIFSLIYVITNGLGSCNYLSCAAVFAVTIALPVTAAVAVVVVVRYRRTLADNDCTCMHSYNIHTYQQTYIRKLHTYTYVHARSHISVCVYIYIYI